MLTRSKRGKAINPISAARRNEIVGLIRLPIVVNEAVSQRRIDYKSNEEKSKSRKIKETDHVSIPEWISYPFRHETTGDMTAIAQFNDEDDMLYINPFNIMDQFAFYRQAMYDLISTNDFARIFVMEYIKNIDVKCGW